MSLLVKLLQLFLHFLTYYVTESHLKLQAPYMDNKFFYFAYGSSMNTRRMALGKADFVVYGPAHLPDHRLDFITETTWWNGAVPTLCKEPGESVWGVLYVIKWQDKHIIETQEGVGKGWYHEVEVTVFNHDGIRITAITYVQNHSPRKIPSTQTRPMDRRPSTTYLKVMILGASEAGLPSRYIDNLYNIPHNGRRAVEDLLTMLGPPFSDFHRPKKEDNLFLPLEMYF